LTEEGAESKGDPKIDLKYPLHEKPLHHGLALKGIEKETPRILVVRQRG